LKREKKADEFSQTLYETRRFTVEHLSDNIEEAREKIKQQALESKNGFDYYSLEYRIRNKVEFDIYYQGLELFKSNIVKDIEDRTKEIQYKL
jgi:hypothetical protein